MLIKSTRHPYHESHEQARRIIADPVPENQVSIAVLEKRL